jgi:4-diphosphocytidyl-2-C-methyl-D-erythritol kinase
VALLRGGFAQAGRYSHFITVFEVLTGFGRWRPISSLDMSLSISAHAKLNLALAVGPPQPPRGYHPIHSWFVPVELHDTVTITPLSADQPSHHVVEWAAGAPRPSPIDWPLEKDLAVRAHRQLEAEVGRSLPVQLTITKRIPVGGGLGGGSSDAAAALMALNRAFALRLPSDRLRELSTKLGSDVAFFIDDEATIASPRPAVVSGFGEIISRVSTIPADVLLIFPPFGCPTGPVYAAFDRRSHSPIDPARIDTLFAAASGRQAVPVEALFNDLLVPALAVEPRLMDLIDRLDAAARRLGARIHMTGSGSTLFAIVPPSSPGAALAAAIREAASEVAVVPTRLI